MKKSHVSINEQRFRYLAIDFVTGLLAFMLFNITRYYLLHEKSKGFVDLWGYLFSTKLIIEECIVPLAMLGIYWLSGYYNQPLGKSRLQEFLITFFSAIVNTILIYLVLLINDQTGHRIVNYELILILMGLLWILPYCGRLIITGITLNQSKREGWHFKVLIVGNSTGSRQIASKLNEVRSNVKYKVIGFVEIPGEKDPEDGKKGFPLEEIEEICTRYDIEQLVLAPESNDEKKILKLMFRLFSLGIPIKILPDTYSYVTSAIRLKDIYGEPFIDLTSPSIGECSKNIKRTIDVLMSSFFLLILSPLYLFLACAVRLSSSGPVIYSKERIGLHQKPFRIFKFRSMITDSENEGPQLSSDNDPRITKVGKWMRKFRLDELPQFWNVLKGDMSVVGPRPEREFYIRQILEKAPYYVLVCQVRPGITSWGMVKYGYASNVEQMVERTRYDLLYLANMSLSMDAKIMIYTLRTILKGSGM